MTPAPRIETPARPEVVTFGCRLNAAEGDRVGALAAEAGRGGDLVVVNTCAVTGEAVRQARQAIRRLARERPGAEIVVTGCAAQIDPASFAAMPEVARVLGNVEKLKPATWGAPRSNHADADARTRVGDIMAETTPPAPLETAQGRARAFLQVQTGCDHRCTFCVIPYGRGNARSVPAGEAAAQARRLVEAGFSEIVLTGVDLTSWGGDLPGAPKLGRLVRAILEACPSLPRLRLSSVDAVEIDPELLDFIVAEPRVCPHLHLSLQSGDDMILKRMKRRHARAEAIALCARLRAGRPDIVFGADLIAGFPTETEAMFENSLRLVEDCGLTYLHVFPFSPRPGTPAARMPQVPGSEIKERAARLREAGDAALAGFLARLVGQEADGLLEGGGLARLANFAPVRVAEGPGRPGALVRVRITGAGAKEARGEVVAAAAPG